MAICVYEKCQASFVPKSSRQKYCSTNCCGYAARIRWVLSHGGRKNIPALVRRDFAIGKRYSVLKFAAKARGLSVEISKQEYAALVANNCHWCGALLPKTGGGIDRLDNTLGYTVLNCVPCCTQCNNAKNDYPSDVFLTWIKRVYEKNFREGTQWQSQKTSG